jgi:hypothetical protein
MSSQVKVTSLDALESFRASLIIFLTKGRRSVDDVGDEVRRTRQWVQHDQRLHWENELRRRRRDLAQAEQELFSAKLSGLRDNIAVPQAAVRRAKAAVDEAEGKLRNIKRWNRDYDGLVDPLLKRLQGLREIFDHDLPHGITFLVEALRTLEAYAETATPVAAPPVADARPADAPDLPPV